MQLDYRPPRIDIPPTIGPLARWRRASRPGDDNAAFSALAFKVMLIPTATTLREDVSEPQ